MIICTIEEGSERHGRYNVWLGDEPIVVNGRDPEHEACRKLLAMGITGQVEFRDRKTGMLRTTFRSIEASAKLSVVETEHGFRKVAWKPFPVANGRSQTATEASEAAE